MRPLFLSLVLLVTGCATAPRAKSASERLAELKRERQGAPAPASPQAPAPEAPPEAPVPPVAEAPQPPAPPEPPPAAPAPTAPEAPTPPTAPVSAPIQENGPHKGALGLHGSLFGSVTGTTTSSVSIPGSR